MFHENISMAEYPQFIHGIFAFIHIHFILKLHQKSVVILVEYIVNAIVISAKPRCLFYFHTKSHKNVRNQNRITFTKKIYGFSCRFVKMIEINSSQCSSVWHLPFAWISSNRWKTEHTFPVWLTKFLWSVKIVQFQPSSLFLCSKWTPSFS